MKHLTFMLKPSVAWGVALALSCPVTYAASDATFSGTTLRIPHVLYKGQFGDVLMTFKAPDKLILAQSTILAAKPSAPQVSVSDELTFNLAEINVGGQLYRADIAPVVKGVTPVVGTEFKVSFVMPSFINKLFIGDKITGLGVLDDHGFVGCTWGGRLSPDGKTLMAYDCGEDYGRLVYLDNQNARLVVQGKLAGSESTWPWAVSNNGDLAGIVEINTTPDNKDNPTLIENAFYRKAGADPVNIGTLGAGKTSKAFGINNKGVVVGWATTKTDGKKESGHTAFMYDAATKKLSALSGAGLDGQLSFGFDVNDAGQIAGVTTASDGSVLGFVYKDGQVKTLGSLDNSGFSEARAINDKGWTTGFSDTADGSTAAFIHDGTTMTKIPGLSGDSKGNGINNLGHVIGTYTDTIDGSTRFFLYKDGKVTDVFDALSAADKDKWMDIFNLNDIGDDGSISGDGRYYVDKASKKWVWQAFKIKL